MGGADRPHLRGVPLVYPLCGGQIRFIAFITHSADILQMLDHLGVPAEPPNIAPAHGPPLWKNHGDAQVGAQVEPEWDLVGQPAPYYDVDQGVNW